MRGYLCLVTLTRLGLLHKNHSLKIQKAWGEKLKCQQKSVDYLQMTEVDGYLRISSQ